MTEKTIDTLKIGTDINAREITLTITADEARQILSALSESDNKGEWIKIKNGYKCSKCGHIMDKVLSVSGNLIYQYSSYCPECGKKMCLEGPTEEGEKNIDLNNIKGMFDNWNPTPEELEEFTNRLPSFYISSRGDKSE